MGIAAFSCQLGAGLGSWWVALLLSLSQRHEQSIQSICCVFKGSQLFSHTLPLPKIKVLSQLRFLFTKLLDL